MFGVAVAEMRSPAIPSIFANLGYDFLFFDMEHSAEGFETVCDLVWASRLAGITPLVRVPDPERFYISRVLDAGAQGVIVPRVETAEQVQSIVSFSRYPPEGGRGVALGSRHTAFQPVHDPREAMRQANAQVLVGIQIETLAGLQNVEEIASCPGVDLLFIGPQDLSVSLNLPNQWEAPAMDEAIRRVVAVADKHQLPVGIQGRNLDLSTRWMAEGVRFVVYGTTLLLLMQGAQQGLRGLHEFSSDLRKEVPSAPGDAILYRLQAEK